MSITDKGFVFSVDLVLTAIMIFLMLFLITASFSAKSSQTVAGMKRFQLEKNAVFIVDSLVKNSVETPLLGAALFDGEKHRVKSNELEHNQLKRAVPVGPGEFFVQRLSIKWKNGEKETIIWAEQGEKNCIALDRIALIGDESVLVELALCEK